MKRKGSAVWQGGLKDGKGVVSTGSGTLKDVSYTFASRFEEGKGTNPEELVAAAHAGCYSMALSFILGMSGITPESISTTATVTIEQIGDGFEVTASHLDVTAKVPGVDKAKFDEAAKAAETGCPISKLMKCKITMEYKLES